MVDLGKTDIIINRNIIGGFSRINQSIPLSLNKIQTASFCEFCYIENHSSLSFIINKGTSSNPKLWYLNTGFAQDNTGKIDGTSYSKVGTSPLSNFNNEGNVLVLTDKNYYYSENSGSTWNKVLTSGIIGKGGTAKSISVGKYYCSLNSGKDKIRYDSSNYNSRVDSENSCTDYYLKNYFQLLTTPAPSSWICGTHQSGWTTPTKCGTYGTPIYSDSTCTGTSFSCSSYPSVGPAPYAGDCPPPPSSPPPSTTTSSTATP